MQCRIFLVDDHPAMRQGLRLLLDGEEGFAVVGEASSGAEALEKVPEAAPNVILVDLRMKGMDGFELTKRLRSRFNDLRIIVVTSHDTKSYVARAQAKGANGFVCKKKACDCLPAMVRKVMKGADFLFNGRPFKGKTAA